MRRALALGLLLIPVSCVRPPAPAPVARPQPTPIARPLPAPAPVASDWVDRPVTAGDWSFWSDGETSTAGYGLNRQSILLALTCDRRARTVALRRSFIINDVSSVRMTVRTTSTARSFTDDEAKLVATDPLLDAMAFSRGKIMVEASNAPELILPSWPEIARVIEDCRA